MRQKELERIKKILVSQREEIIKRLRESENSIKQLDDDPSDIADLASSSYSRDFNLRQLNKDRQTLELIDEALSRIDKRGFGRCQACGAPIEFKRLY